MADKTVTVRPSGGDYTSLQAAITGEVSANANLVTMAGILYIRKQGTWSSASDTTTVTVDGFTTSAAYYVCIIDESTGAETIAVSSGNGLYLNDPYSRAYGVTSSAGYYGIYIGQTDCVLDSCLVRNSIRGIRTGPNTKVINTIVTDVGTRGIYAESNSGFVINNCVVTNSAGTGIDLRSYNGTLTNVYVGGCTGNDYTGTGTLTMTNCYSEDGTLSTPTAAYSTSTFTNITEGSEDFSLASGSALIGEGTDLSADAVYPFDYDFTGAERVTWDVSAYYFAVSSGITGAGGIASGAALGSPSISAGVTAAGIASGAAIGAPSLAASIAATGIASAAAVGAPSLAASIVAAGISSGAAVGSPAISAAISVQGIASAGAIGQPTVSAGISAEGIVSGEAVGQPTVGSTSGTITGAGGIASAAALGSPAIGAGIQAVGIASGAVVGTPSIAAQIMAESITSVEAVGSPALAAEIIAAGIPSAAAVGSPIVGEYTPTLPPSAYIIVLEAESRTVTIDAENRSIIIPAESRILAADAESRLVAVEA